MGRLSICALVLASACVVPEVAVERQSAPLVLESTQWVPAPSGPSARTGASMAYDVDRQRVVLVGGSNGGTQFNETWEFDGTTWAPITISGAKPLNANAWAMAYDSIRDVMVLEGTYLTWEYNGATSTWVQRTPTTPCGLYSQHRLAFDSARGVIVAFGGDGIGNLWEYNGTTWTVAAAGGSGPPPQNSPPMAYDAARGVTTVHLGENKTWEWNGATWQLRALGGAVSASGSMAFDSVRSKLVMYSQGDSFAWEFDGVGWVKRSIFPGVIRFGEAMTFTEFSTQGNVMMGFGTNLGSFVTQGDVWFYRAHGGACTVGTDCDTGNCVDGVCCEQSACATCQRCDGTSPGNCTTVANAQDPDTCSGSNTCGPGGLCGAVNGTACSAPADCSSGACVDGRCCNTSCAGACRACNAATLGWAGGVDGVCTNAPANSTDPLCSPFVCGASGACVNSCTTDANCQVDQYCAANNQCAARKLQGAPCDATADCKVAGCQVCASGFCTDGVCCDSGCTGQCMACNTPGSQGTCSLLAEGTPDAACPTTAASTCGADGTCDAQGGCRLWPSGTECVATSCTVDQLSQNNQRVCDGAGSCSLASVSSCGAYKCVGSACATICANTNQCAGANVCAGGTCAGGVACATTCSVDANCCVGEFCVNGACVDEAELGHPCTDPSDCASGFCANGVCCNEACTDGCFACDLAGEIGQCTPKGTPACGGCAITCVDHGDCCAGDRCIMNACTSGTAPTITSTAPATAFVDEEYGYDLVANGSAPLLFALAPNGFGATLANAAQGQIRWTPASVGSVMLSATATNPWGTDTQEFTVSVGAARAPAIVEDANLTAVVGQPYVYNGALRVHATGAQSSMAFLKVSGPSDLTIAADGAVAWSPTVTGTASVTVQATNDFGIDQYTFAIAVSGATTAPTPVAKAGTTDGVTRGVFPFLARLDGSGSTGVLERYSWSFGDGSAPIDDIAPVHAYAAPGGYIARLRVTDQAGRTDTDTIGIGVTNGAGAVPPIVRIGVDKPAGGESALSVSFHCECDEAPGAVLLWLFGDGGESSDAYPTHVYVNGGTYEVSLYALDPVTGMTAVDRIQIEVTQNGKRPPSAHAYADPAGGNLTTTAPSLTVQLTSDASDPDGQIITTRWTLDGLEVATTPAFTHVLTEAKVHVFKLEVTDNDGLVSSSQVDVTVLSEGAVPPQIISRPATRATVGEPFTYTVGTRGDRPLTYGVLEALAGLSIDSQGRVTWTPTQAQLGIKTAKIFVDNPAGRAVQQLTVEVKEGTAPPKDGCQMSPRPEAAPAPWLAIILAIAFVVRRGMSLETASRSGSRNAS